MTFKDLLPPMTMQSYEILSLNCLIDSLINSSHQAFNPAALTSHMISATPHDVKSGITQEGGFSVFFPQAPENSQKVPPLCPFMGPEAAELAGGAAGGWGGWRGGGGGGYGTVTLPGAGGVGPSQPPWLQLRAAAKRLNHKLRVERGSKHRRRSPL